MTTLELVQQERILELERELYRFRMKSEAPFNGEPLDLDQIIPCTVVHVPLYGIAGVTAENFQLKVIARTVEGFALFVDSKNYSNNAYEEAKLFDILIQKVQNSFVKYLTKRYST